MKRDCATCMFFDGNYPGTLSSEGVCRGVPPTVILVGDQWQTGWPTVIKGEWCGAWQAADDKRQSQSAN